MIKTSLKIILISIACVHLCGCSDINTVGKKNGIFLKEPIPKNNKILVLSTVNTKFNNRNLILEITEIDNHYSIPSLFSLNKELAQNAKRVLKFSGYNNVVIQEIPQNNPLANQKVSSTTFSKDFSDAVKDRISLGNFQPNLDNLREHLTPSAKAYLVQLTSGQNFDDIVLIANQNHYPFDAQFNMQCDSGKGYFYLQTNYVYKIYIINAKTMQILSWIGCDFGLEENSTTGDCKKL